MTGGLDIALIRWSVKCRTWQELTGRQPDLGAFLAGWYLRKIGWDQRPGAGNEAPKGIEFRDSLMIGWSESDSHQIVLDRDEVGR